jgi:septal ring factor EnvC (AmiA/AmiB activator)
MPALQSTLDSVNSRLISTEQQVSASANDRVGFPDRMSKIEESVGSNLKTVRNEARSMAQQIKYETGQSLQALQNRVTGVESIQREHSEEVARVRTELAGVRQELASVREDNIRQTNQISQLEQAHQSTRNDVSGLDRRLSSNQTAVGALSYQVGRKRTDFELKNGRTLQVVDGIYVTIKNTDVERQRVDGWVQIASDGRIVWLRGEGAQNAIDFSSRADARPYQLVFTRVGRDSAVGYVLVPITNSASAATN